MGVNCEGPDIFTTIQEKNATKYISVCFTARKTVHYYCTMYTGPGDQYSMQSIQALWVKTTGARDNDIMGGVKTKNLGSLRFKTANQVTS